MARASPACLVSSINQHGKSTEMATSGELSIPISTIYSSRFASAHVNGKDTRYYSSRSRRLIA